jgi:hypothetical protein
MITSGTIAMKKVIISSKRIWFIGKNANKVAARTGPIIEIIPDNKKLAPFIRLNLSLGTMEGTIAKKAGT